MQVRVLLPFFIITDVLSTQLLAIMLDVVVDAATNRRTSQAVTSTGCGVSSILSDTASNMLRRL
jgi:hypothetical protein